MPDEKDNAESSPAEKPESQEPVEEKTANDDKADETSASNDTESEPEGKSEGKDENATSPEDEKLPEPKKESKAEKRIKQLTAKVRTLEEKIHSIPPVPEIKPLIEPSEPKIESYETIDDYNKALQDFKQRYGEYVRENTRRETVEADRKAKYDAETKKLQAEIVKREAKTIARNPEYDRNEAYATVRPNPTMDGFLVDSEIGPDLLWELHENPDDVERLRELPPFKIVRELIKIESRILARIKGINPKPKSEITPTYVTDKGANPIQPKSLEDLLYK